MSVEKLVEHFSALEDPRCAGKVDHRLIDILVIAVCAVIACAESWDDIALYGRACAYFEDRANMTWAWSRAQWSLSLMISRTVCEKR